MSNFFFFIDRSENRICEGSCRVVASRSDLNRMSEREGLYAGMQVLDDGIKIPHSLPSFNFPFFLRKSFSERRLMKILAQDVDERFSCLDSIFERYPEFR